MAGRLPGLRESTPSGTWGRTPRDTVRAYQPMAGNDSYPPALPSTTVTSTSDMEEKAVMHYYTARPLRDHSEKNIHDFMLVMGLRQTLKNKDPDTITAMHLGQCNVRLALQYELARTLFEYERSEFPPTVDPDVVAIARITPDNHWFFKKNDTMLGDAIKSNKILQPLQYTVPDGVRMAMNILGIIQTLKEDNVKPHGGRPSSHILNIAVKNRVPVLNYWGTRAVKGARLWLILKRRYNKETGRYAELAFVPYVTIEDAQPPLAARRYVDHTGTEQQGPVFHVGVVLDNEKPVKNDKVSLRAAGLIGDASEMQDACGSLPDIEINYCPAFGSMNHWLE